LARLACLARPVFHAPRLVRNYLVGDNFEEFNLEYERCAGLDQGGEALVAIAETRGADQLAFAADLDVLDIVDPNFRTVV